MKQILVFALRLVALLAALVSAVASTLALLIVVYVLVDFVHALTFDGELAVRSITWEGALSYVLVIVAATRLGDVTNIISGKLLRTGSPSSGE